MSRSLRPQPSARSESKSVSAMVSGRMLLLSASCWLLVVVGSCEELIEERSPEDDAIKTQEEKELVSQDETSHIRSLEKI